MNTNKENLSLSWKNLKSEFSKSKTLKRPTYKLFDYLSIFLISFVKWIFLSFLNIIININKFYLKLIIPRTYFNPRGGWP